MPKSKRKEGLAGKAKPKGVKAARKPVAEPKQAQARSVGTGMPFGSVSGV